MNINKMIGCLMIYVLTIALPTFLSGDIFILNTISQTVSKYSREKEHIYNAFAQTGLYPNKMAITDNYIYLVNSGDNNIQKIDLITGDTVNFIDLEDYTNPYDIIIHDGYGYVTALLANKVFKIDLSLDKVVAEVEVGTAPQGLLTVNGYLYVANSGFSYPDYFEGTVSVISLDDFSIIDTISVHLNPQRMTVDADKNIHLVCTGDYADNTGLILIIDTSDNSVIRSVDFHNYPLNIAIMPNGKAYVGDAYNAGVYSYDIYSYEIVNDVGNPFASGGASYLLNHDDTLIIADAKDFQSNSTISAYGLDGNLMYSFQSAVGAIDIGVTSSHTNIEKTLSVPVVEVYPNPSKEYFQFQIIQPQTLSLDIDNNVVSGYQISIFNLKGQLINHEVTDSNCITWDGVDINNKQVSSGLYFVKIADTKEQVIATTRITLIR